VSRPPNTPEQEPYDEAFAAPDVPRAHYAALLGALGGVDLASLRDAVNERVARDGVTFTTGAGEEAFVIDPVPRILPADEWAALAAGLEQRARALNAFVLDAYGERRIVAAGLISDDVIDSAEGYEPDLRGAYPSRVPPIGIAGLDIVRAPGGALQVLEDNVRAPSGFTYRWPRGARSSRRLPPACRSRWRSRTS
jgi:glutamate---cysteine ligase / carboxylate-amine ligase